MMGPAPLATGYWGRGTNQATAMKYQNLYNEYIKRPARKQIAKIEAKYSTV